MSEATITSFFEHDHARLDGLFADYRDLKSRDAAKAKENFREFKDGLLHHIRWEEDILFPSFEEATGLHGVGPTQVMRSEHRQIEKQLGVIDAKLSGGEVSTEEEDQVLLSLLVSHNQKEEHVLYPAIDHSLSPDGRREVFEKMKSL